VKWVIKIAGAMTIQAPAWVIPNNAGYGGVHNVPRPRTDQPLSLPFTALATEKPSLREAAMVMAAPVAGLRPSRAGLLLTLNFPNPGIETSSPLAAASAMAAKTPSTIFLASALVTPWAMAICYARSLVFIYSPFCPMRAVARRPLA